MRAIERSLVPTYQRAKCAAKRNIRAVGTTMREFYRDERGSIDVCAIAAGVALFGGLTYLAVWGRTSAHKSAAERENKRQLEQRQLMETEAIVQGLAEVGRMTRDETGIAAAIAIEQSRHRLKYKREAIVQAADLSASVDELFALIASEISTEEFLIEHYEDAQRSPNVHLRVMDTLVRQGMERREVFNRVFLMHRRERPWAKALLTTGLIDQENIDKAKVDAKKRSIIQATCLYVNEAAEPQFTLLSISVATTEETREILNTLFTERWATYGPVSSMAQRVERLIGFLIALPFTDLDLIFAKVGRRVTFILLGEWHSSSIDGASRSSQQEDPYPHDFSDIILRGLVKRLGVAGVVAGLLRSRNTEEYIVGVAEKAGENAIAEHIARSSTDLTLLAKLARKGGTVGQLARQNYRVRTGLDID